MKRFFIILFASLAALLPAHWRYEAQVIAGLDAYLFNTENFIKHGGALKPFRNANFFHGYTIFAFVCVLVTYFGVNLLLGGMHSYM